MTVLRAFRRPLLTALSGSKRWATGAAVAPLTASHDAIEPPPIVPATSYESKWKTTQAVPLTRQSFLDLMYGRTPLIRRPDFVSQDVCWKHEQILSPQLAPYKHNTGPPLAKVGVAQFEYQAQSANDFKSRADSPQYDEYFRDAAKWHSLHSDLAAKTGVNLWEEVIDTVAALVPEWDVELASQGPGKVYFSGIYRALNHSTYLHCDWSPYDSATEAWVVNQVTHQAVFNLYLAPVVEGGETTVYDYQWDEAALRQREPAHYGYHDALVADRQRTVVRPEPGALCFFNSRNIHQVASVVPRPMPELGLEYRPRLTLSSFMGLLPSSATGGRPKLILWS